MSKSLIRNIVAEPIYELGNLSILAKYLNDDHENQGSEKTLKMASSLQTSMDINNLIDIFSNEIKSFIKFGSLSYINKPLGIDLHLGKTAKHACTYKLTVNSDHLGELSITRGKKFSSDESKLIEHLLCVLVYPLRNALLYKRAITAASKDPLTGANNRTSMDRSITREIELAKRHDTPLSLISLDIDHFKQINDSYGHIAGDAVLKTLTQTINNCIRNSDLLFRYGGEEFVILLSNTTKKGALLLAERIRRAVEKQRVIVEKKKITTTASFGVACFSFVDTYEKLFEKADMAMYQSKADGRNCVRFCE